MDLGAPGILSIGALLRLHRIADVCVAVRQPGTDHARIACESATLGITLYDFAGPEDNKTVDRGLPGRGRCAIL